MGIYIGDNKFYVSEEENKRAIGCSKTEVHLENIKYAPGKQEETKAPVKAFSTRAIRRGLETGKLLMYEYDKEYIIKDRKGKIILSFNKDGKT